jgi:hypothetical protein
MYPLYMEHDWPVIAEGYDVVGVKLMLPPLDTLV